MSRNIKRELAASGLASVSAVGMAVAGLPLALIGLGALGCYFGVRSLIPGELTEAQQLEQLRQDAQAYEGHVKLKIHQIIKNREALSERGSQAIGMIAETARYILLDIQDHPHKLSEARYYLNHHLDSTVKILSKYRELVAKKSDRAPQYETRIADLLERVAASFEKGKRSLLDEDVTTLEAEIEVLDTTLELET